MIPLRDTNPTRTTPFVNYALLASNVAVFVWAKLVPPWYETGYALIPSRFVGDVPGEFFTIFTSMFLHANIAHIGGNLLFLYIFGDNVEDALGHVRYVVFYFLAGLVAGLSQVGIDPTSTIPMVGASGAIAGVTGGYMVLFPRAPIVVLNPVFPLWFLMGPFFVFPAWLIAGEFFVMNLLMGVHSLGAASVEERSGIAVFAHLGGFVAGLLAIRPMLSGRYLPDPRKWHGWRSPRADSR